ncbi:MAG: hypothetical protein GY703_05260 [Gammaproteobacteria bacterium]|nr:hypothetical protein [Gammaproteobacteria bacterium]
MRTWLVLIVLTLFTICQGVQAADKARPETQANTDIDRYQSYLEAVRAQRLSAMEARRKAAQEAAEEHRKRVDPWGEAYRRNLDELSRWHQLTTQAQREERKKQLYLRNPAVYWDNSWYYRGY